MNKIFKKFLVVILALTIVFTSIITSYEKTNAAGLTLGTIALGVAFLGSVYFACDYVSNPDKYSDLKDSMKDFANTTVENQKKLYEIEKANFEMVMNKAVDAGIGTCLVGPNGVHITAKQLQQQEYPEFDTWKGYKEKESQKPKSSLWDKFKMAAGLADFICKLWPDGKSPLPDGGSGSEQRYYTGDDGYIDRKTGAISITMNTLDLRGNLVNGEFYVATNRYNLSGAKVLNDDNEKEKIRVCSYVEGHVGSSDRYENGSATTFFRVDVRLASPKFGYSGSSYLHDLMADWEYTTNLWNGSDYTGDSLTYKNSSSDFRILYSCQLNNPYDAWDIALTDWDMVSCNIPIFDDYTHARSYVESGSLDGLLNGYFGGSDPTPTVAPAPPSTVSPVRQYVNYFSNTFSPSVMPYHVNYNIVNNWDGNDSTFNINNYTDVTVPTLTPAPDADGNDTNITNNLIINQVNILTEISETVTNIYNFFQIDVDYINEELKMDEDENPTGFDDLKNLISQFEAAFPSDKVSDVTQELDLLYPKITIQVPKALDRFLDAGDDKVIMEDGVKKIVLCDFKDYAIYFARFRKFLEIVLRIGLIFYLLKELTVVFSIA